MLIQTGLRPPHKGAPNIRFFRMQGFKGSVALRYIRASPRYPDSRAGGKGALMQPWVACSMRRVHSLCTALTLEVLGDFEPLPRLVRPNVTSRLGSEHTALHFPDRISSKRFCGLLRCLQCLKQHRPPHFFRHLRNFKTNISQLLATHISPKSIALASLTMSGVTSQTSLLGSWACLMMCRKILIASHPPYAASSSTIARAFTFRISRH